MVKSVYYTVAGHSIRIDYVQQQKEEQLLTSFLPFIDDEKPEEQLLFSLRVDDDFRWETLGKEEHREYVDGGRTRVFRTPEGSYQFEFCDATRQIVGNLQAEADFSKACLSLLGTTASQRHYVLNNALMLCYAFAAVHQDTLLMHASVVRYQGKAVLCLGKSGTGKSTHTGLWLQHIPNTDLLNDDNPVLRLMPDGTVLVFGSPWSGKTPCYRNESALVAGILRLSQQPENTIRRTTGLQAFADLLPSASNMRWDSQIMHAVCSTVERMLPKLAVYQLGCLPDKAAARLSFTTIFEA